MRLTLLPMLAPCAFALLAACEAPPASRIGSRTSLEVVLDTAVFDAADLFQIHVLKGTIKSGASLTCADIPGTYRVDSEQVEAVVDPSPTAQKDKTNPSKAVVVPQIRVPADQPLVVVVRALAAFKGTLVVGRGCEDNLTFKQGSQNSVSVDVRATTGKSCSKPTDCEANVTCVQGPGFSDGYCAVTQCASGGRCPPGSACISDATLGGICMRLCKSINDCEADVSDVQDCQGRQSLSSQGCERVCVFPNWQKDNCCSNCGISDGGV